MAPTENQSYMLHKVLKMGISYGDKGRDERTFLCCYTLPLERSINQFEFS